MMIGIFFIDRIINYIPTYSGKYYETINLTTIILIFILFMLLTHGGFRLRTAILLQRFDDWFTIDDIIARKLGMTPKPFDIMMDDVNPVCLTPHPTTEVVCPHNKRQTSTPCTPVLLPLW
jgi:hypothetical protein